MTGTGCSVRKIIITAFFLCVISAFCFAKGTGEFFSGIPMNWSRGAYGYDEKVMMTSLSLGIGLSSPIKGRFSWVLWDELMFPLKFDGSINGADRSRGTDDYETLIGMSIFTGPKINIHSAFDGKFKIPLILGVRWMWVFMSEGNTSIFGNQFGIGLGIGGEYYFKETIYVFGRLMFYYDFYSVSLTKISSAADANPGFANSFELTPTIGIGMAMKGKGKGGSLRKLLP